MLNWIIWNKTVLTLTPCIAQSARAVEYTDPMSVLVYDTKQSDGAVPVMLGNAENPFIVPRSTLARRSSTW